MGKGFGVPTAAGQKRQEVFLGLGTLLQVTEHLVAGERRAPDFGRARVSRSQELRGPRKVSHPGQVHLLLIHSVCRSFSHSANLERIATD